MPRATEPAAPAAMSAAGSDFGPGPSEDDFADDCFEMMEFMEERMEAMGDLGV